MTKTYEVTWSTFEESDWIADVKIPNADKMTKEEIIDYINDHKYDQADETDSFVLSEKDFTYTDCTEENDRGRS